MVRPFRIGILVLVLVRVLGGGVVTTSLQLPPACKDDEPLGRNLCQDLGLGSGFLGDSWGMSKLSRPLSDYILSYNMVQDHERDIVLVRVLYS